ncbi:MAG: tetratricopeptide repeat protein [Candidatus Sericytochromatia bacterium]
METPVFLERLNQPRLLQLTLALSWGTFVCLGVLVSAACFSWLFLPLAWQLPLSLTGLIMSVAALRLLMIGLGMLHDLRARQLSEQPKQAELHFRWALRLTPGNLNIYCHWAAFKREQGNASEARDLLERARNLDPAHDEPCVQLAHLALSQGNWKEASFWFDRGYRLRRGVAWNDLPERTPDETPTAPSPHVVQTTVSKLNHDIQQLEFLIAGRYLSPAFRSIQQACQDLLRETLGQGQGPRIKLTKAQHARLLLWYGRNVHISPVPAFPREVLHPDLPLRELETRYQAAQPGMVWVDNLLQPDALEALLHFCQKSTIWHDDTKTGGYLGAYMDDGFSCELLYQVAHELRDALPGIFQGLPLKHMWAYKYDSQREGIGIHADSAVINVNFWLTPDEANRDPNTGGLLVYPVRAPLDWSFEDYNHDTDKALALIAQEQAEPIHIPYRQNRAVIFDSRLFHATDRFQFSESYLMRRINVTLLYGTAPSEVP